MARRGRYRGLNPRDVATAKAESYVRYAPKRSALAGLISEAKGEYKAEKRGARAGARQTIRGVRKARKPLAQIYDEATGAADSAATDVATAFGALGSAADPFRAATAREQGGAKTRIATERAGALADLTARQVEAKVGRQFALQQAKAAYRENMGKLAQQLLDLGDQQGADEAARLGQLAGERADRRAEIRKERIAQRGREKLESQKHGYRLEEQAAKQEAEAKAGPRPATAAEERAFTTNFSKALRYAKQYKAQGVKRADAANTLVTGAPASRESPGVPSIADQVALSAALDLAYNGVIQPDTAKRIRRTGIKPRILPGENTIAEQLRRARRQGIGQR